MPQAPFSSHLQILSATSLPPASSPQVSLHRHKSDRESEAGQKVSLPRGEIAKVAGGRSLLFGTTQTHQRALEAKGPMRDVRVKISLTG